MARPEVLRACKMTHRMFCINLIWDHFSVTVRTAFFVLNANKLFFLFCFFYKEHKNQELEVYFLIFTLANNFLRWTYFGRTRFIHPWMTLIQLRLCVSDVIDKCNSWLASVTFNWRHIIVMAVERNNQTLIITFLCRLFTRFKSKLHK